jgi:hypothetical protein
MVVAEFLSAEIVNSIPLNFGIWNFVFGILLFVHSWLKTHRFQLPAINLKQNLVYFYPFDFMTLDFTTLDFILFVHSWQKLIANYEHFHPNRINTTSNLLF